MPETRVSFNQRNFGLGMLNQVTQAQKEPEILTRAVAGLENMVVTDQGTLKKREGLERVRQIASQFSTGTPEVRWDTVNYWEERISRKGQEFIVVALHQKQTGNFSVTKGGKFNYPSDRVFICAVTPSKLSSLLANTDTGFSDDAVYTTAGISFSDVAQVLHIGQGSPDFSTARLIKARQNSFILTMALAGGKYLPPIKIQGTTQAFPDYLFCDLLGGRIEFSRPVISPREFSFDRFIFAEEPIIFYGSGTVDGAGTYPLKPNSRGNINKLPTTLGVGYKTGSPEQIIYYEATLNVVSGHAVVSIPAKQYLNVTETSPKVQLGLPYTGGESDVFGNTSNQKIVPFKSMFSYSGGGYGGLIGNNFDYFSLVYLPEDILEYLPGMGGPLMARFITPTETKFKEVYTSRFSQENLTVIANGLEDGAVSRDVLFWVFPLDVPGSSANALACFKVGGGQQGTSFYSFHNFAEALFLMQPANPAGTSTSLYSLPKWSWQEGHPSRWIEEGGRLFGVRGRNVRASQPPPNDVFGFNIYIPSNKYRPNPGGTEGLSVEWDDTLAAKVGEVTGPNLVKLGPLTENVKPAPDEGAEVLYWYLFQLLSSAEAPLIAGEISGDKKDEIQWVESLRGLVLGTGRAEIHIPLEQLSKGTLSVKGVQSFRGSKKPISEKGDYGIFFVDNTGRDIWGLFYDDGVKGYRSTQVTKAGVEFKQDVRQIMWDDTLRCLWVMLEPEPVSSPTLPVIPSEIYQFFVQQENGISGWSKFSTSLPGFEPTHFISLSGRVGIYDASYKAVLGPSSSHKDTLGDTTAEVISKTSLIKEGPPGQTGDSSNWVKQVGETTVTVRNCSFFKVGRNKLQGKGPETAIVDASGKTPSGISPRLEIEHTLDEPFEIMASFSKYLIQEK